MSPAVQPSLSQITELIRNEGSPRPHLIPIFASIPADLTTPTAAYLKLSQTAKHSFLFESVSGGERLERYSYLGANPVNVVKTGAGHGESVDPLIDLESRINASRSVQYPGLPPFTGGAIGYVGYDCVRYFEPKTFRDFIQNPLNLAESVLMYFNTIVAFDHIYQTIKIISHIEIPPTDDDRFLKDAYDNTASIILDIYNTLLETPVPLPQQPPIDLSKANQYQSNVGRDGYKNFVTQLKKNIQSGDIIQAVPSQRIARPTSLHPFNLYRHLRSVNPSPYLFYIECGGDYQIVGASPELLVKSDYYPDKGTRIITHPIAGTIKRGQTPEEDDALASQLINSAKDRAEHVMLVDLARNDVNRVCKPETTTVERLMGVERFSHVMHLVSEVSGILRPGKTAFDALRSIFPAGTVSGAPKIKAMELIAELERQKRGVYAGAIGRWSYSGLSMDTCIALRTMVYKDGVIYIQAGGGIVFDSDEEEEYIETLNKLKANMAAIKGAEEYYAKHPASS